MSEDNSKKPIIKPPLPGLPSDASKPQDTENKEDTIGFYAPFKESDDPSAVVEKQTDRTSVINLSELTGNTVSRMPARIVPVIAVSTGPEQGRIVSLAQYKSIIIGRDKECELRVYDPNCSRKHAEVWVNEAGKVFIKDLASTNGSKVNGKELVANVEQEIKDGDRLQIGTSTILRHTMMPEHDARIQMDVYFRATRDRLTNAFNRHHFDEALDRETSYQRRTGHGLGILLFDVDHFKKVNDTYGHPGGDEVLRDIGTRVLTVIRTEDIFARIGGEEFGVIVRNDTLDGMKILAERLRQVMEKKPVEFEGRQVWFTISIGLTLVTGTHSINTSTLLQLADDAMYEAKNAGRNRVVIKVASESK